MAQKITLREQKQLHYFIRQRRVNGIFTLYSILLYAAYTIFAFIRYNGSKKLEPAHFAGLVVAPFLIWAVRRVIFWWFNRLTTANSEYINALRSEQQEKLEDLKQKTNFYSTKALLERFDSDFDKANKRKGNIQPKGGPKQPGLKPNPNAPQPAGPAASGPARGPAGQPANHQPNKSIASADFEFAPNLPKLPQPQPQQQLPPHGQAPVPDQPAYPLGPAYNANYQPSWYDKILDIIVGEDEYSPKARYALICQNCRRHNGLAQPGELPQYVIYICPQCGLRNGQEKKKRREQESKDEAVLEETPKVKDTAGDSSHEPIVISDQEDHEDESVEPKQESEDEQEKEPEEVAIKEKPKSTDRPGLHQRKKSRRTKD